jgi:hypothetical protein
LLQRVTNLRTVSLAAARVTRMMGQEILPKTHKHTGGTVNRYLATLSHVFTFAVPGVPTPEASVTRDSAANYPAAASHCQG